VCEELDNDCRTITHRHRRYFAAVTLILRRRANTLIPRSEKDPTDEDSPPPDIRPRRESMSEKTMADANIMISNREKIDHVTQNQRYCT
jgi:hypothetical protein